MNNTFTAVIKKQSNCWIGWIEEIPGVNCQERTREELLGSLKITLAEALVNLESQLLGVGDGQRLELHRLTEIGDDLAHRFLAGWAMGERLGRQWPAQGEFAPAHLAVAFAEFVFVKGHG